MTINISIIKKLSLKFLSTNVVYIFLFFSIIFTASAQEVPVYEEASSFESYSTDVTSQFRKTGNKEFTPPTHQPLQFEKIDTSLFNSISEAERKQMLQKIKSYKEQGRFDLLKNEMLKLLQEQSIRSEDKPGSGQRKLIIGDQTESLDEKPSSVNDESISNSSPPLSNASSKKPSGTLNNFNDADFFKNIDSNLMKMIKNSPDILQKIEKNPSLMKDPSFLEYLEKNYESNKN